MEIFESYPFASQGEIPSLEMFSDEDLFNHFEERYPTERGI